MREKKKKHPFLKKSPGEKLIHPFFFLQFSGRTLSHEKYPFTGHFGSTHGVRPFSEWGGGGGGGGGGRGGSESWSKTFSNIQNNEIVAKD